MVSIALTDDQIVGAFIPSFTQEIVKDGTLSELEKGELIDAVVASPMPDTAKLARDACGFRGTLDEGTRTERAVKSAAIWGANKSGICPDL